MEWTKGIGTDGRHRLIPIPCFWRIGKSGKVKTITLRACEWRSHLQLFPAILQADGELITNKEHLTVRIDWTCHRLMCACAHLWLLRVLQAVLQLFESLSVQLRNMKSMAAMQVALLKWDEMTSIECLKKVFAIAGIPIRHPKIHDNSHWSRDLEKTGFDVEGISTGGLLAATGCCVVPRFL